MWTRLDLKNRAKEVLRKYYWWGLLVCLVGGILSGGGGVISLPFNFNYNFNGNTNGFDKSGDFFRNAPNIDWSIIATFLVIFLIIFTIIIIFSIIYKIFLGNAVKVGMNKYFLEARKDNVKFTNLFYSFNGLRYLNIVKAMVWMDLFVFLWSLLFIIPGIIKQISYSMVPYIMAENPNMRYDDALKLSMKMTDGEKAEIFVLGLSFLGWLFLGVLCCGFGLVFVYPYYYATFAELYIVLREKAINNGIATTEDFGIVKAEIIE